GVERHAACLVMGVAEDGGRRGIPEHDPPGLHVGHDHRVADLVEEPAETEVAGLHPADPPDARLVNRACPIGCRESRSRAHHRPPYPSSEQKLAAELGHLGAKRRTTCSTAGLAAWRI